MVRKCRLYLSGRLNMTKLNKEIKNILTLDNTSCAYIKHTLVWEEKMEESETHPSGKRGIDVDNGGYKVTDETITEYGKNNTLTKLQPLRDAIKGLTGLSQTTGPIYLSSEDGVLKPFSLSTETYAADTVASEFADLIDELEN